jgi:hypothetical protein
LRVEGWAAATDDDIGVVVTGKARPELESLDIDAAAVDAAEGSATSVIGRHAADARNGRWIAGVNHPAASEKCMSCRWSAVAGKE